tara:strand:+ start:131 stop:1531 length:1401 start_codon:yes stop_codon:yes gene_type:complete
MASLQGWGRQTWNSGAWDTFAPVDATGNGLSSSVGTVSLVTTNVFEVNGNNIASSIGDATQASEYAATGNALTSTEGDLPNPTIVNNQLLTGWNRGVGTSLPLGWSTSSWGNGDFILTSSNGLSGVSAATSIGDEVPTGNADVTATAAGLTSSTGTPVATGVAEAIATGNVITPTIGTETVTGSSSVTATGLGLTTSIGDEEATGVPQSGWNRGANQVTGQLIGWSDNLWGTLETAYNFTGNSLTSTAGTMSFQGDVAPTISGLSIASNVTTPGTSIFVTGVGATSAIGSFAISGDAGITVVAASEPELDIFVGTLPITIDAAPQVATASLGTSAITGDSNVTLSGIGTTSSLGTETVSGSAPVTATGNSMTSSTNTPGFQGDVAPTITGNALTASLGEESQASIYTFSGINVSITAGSPTISANATFTVTGVSATSSTGTLGGTFWNQVDDSNSAISWTEVHKAA